MNAITPHPLRPAEGAPVPRLGPAEMARARIIERLERTIAEQREAIDYRDEQILQLRLRIVELTRPGHPSTVADLGVHLTKVETSMLKALAIKAMPGKEALHDFIYGDRPEADWPELKIVDVFICKLRGKLRPIGIEIETVWGQGYRLVGEHRRRVRAAFGLDAEALTDRLVDGAGI